MAEPKPVPRVYSNALSAQSYMRIDPSGSPGRSETSQAQARRSGFHRGDVSEPTKDGRLRSPIRTLNATLGCGPSGLGSLLHIESMDEVHFASTSSRGPLAEAELLPMSSFGAAMYEPVVFMPCADTKPDLTSAHAATAHMTISNGADSTFNQKVHALELDLMSCSYCGAIGESPTGKLAAPRDHAILQDITVGYMKDAGLLDMTLQHAAQSLKVNMNALKVHLRSLSVSKWPSRKRSSIRKLLRHSPDLQGRSKQKVDFFDQTVRELRNALEMEYDNFQVATPARKALIRDLRQRWYKSSAYRHRQRTPSFGTQTPVQTTPTWPSGAFTEPDDCSPGWERPACKRHLSFAT